MSEFTTEWKKSTTFNNYVYPPYIAIQLRREEVGTYEVDTSGKPVICIRYQRLKQMLQRLDSRAVHSGVQKLVGRAVAEHWREDQLERMLNRLQQRLERAAARRETREEQS